MNESLRASSTKKLFLFILIFLVSTDLSILLDIPILRQVLGFAFFVFIPGLLILYILKLNKLGLAEKIVLSVGLSISFLMFFGLFLNQGCLLFGYATPLSTNCLVISLSLATIALLIAAYIRNREAISSVPFHFDLNTRAKWCLLLPCLFPLLSILGMHFLNTSGNNVILLAFLFLIPVSIILIVLQRHKISTNTYPIAIIMITLSLLSMFWLRSEHILGHDVHTEYYLFHTTLLNSHWGILGASSLDSCLSITLLPTMFQSLLHLPGEEYLFKGVYVLICTFTPLSVYVISKKYIGELCAFLAALFFVSQISFLHAAGNPRTNLAIFFFALSIMVLFHKRITGVNQKGLFIIFMAATMVSHYSTAYIFFFLLLFTYLLVLIFRKYTLSRNIALISVALFFVLIFLWYSQVTQGAFTSGVGFIDTTIRNLYRFALLEARSPEVSRLLGGGMVGGILLSRIDLAITWASFGFIGVGIVGTLIERKKMISAPHYQGSSTGFLQSKFETEYLLLAVASSVTLIAMITLPYVSRGYGMERAYSQIAVISSGFFVLGGIMLARPLRVSPYLLILIVLIPYFLFETGALYTVSGYHGATVLSSDAPSLEYELVHAQEIQATQWLQEFREEDYQIYATDEFGKRMLISQGKISPGLIDGYSFLARQTVPGYIYLSYNNVANGELLDREYVVYDMSEYSDELINKNKIYANGGSEVWR